MTLRPKDFLALGRLAARCSDDKKALDIRLLDVRKLTSVADYFLLASAESQVQLQAIYDHIADTIKEQFGLNALHREGAGRSNWIVLDYGGLVVHLFHHTSREFYGLERLWEGAKAVEDVLGTEATVPAKPKTKTKKSHKKVHAR